MHHKTCHQTEKKTATFNWCFTSVCTKIYRTVYFVSYHEQIEIAAKLSKCLPVLNMNAKLSNIKN